MTAAKIIPAMQTVSTANLNTTVQRNLSCFPAISCSNSLKMRLRLQDSKLES
jgi:hypothetical protein